MTHSLIGTKDFYKRTLAVAVPIMVQNGITNFVGMLDNIMIGRLGTDQMSGVSIVNNLLFVWNLCIFGGFSGIGIFTAQFYGKGDREGVRYTMRLMLWLSFILVAGGLLVFLAGSETLIGLYLHADASGADPVRTLHFAQEYLHMMYFIFVPFALVQIYATTLRSTSETLLPMKSGLIAVFVNLIGNYILIYGKLGAPALGVRGAALATVLSRVVEFFFLAVSTHRQTARYPFVEGVFKSLRVPLSLIGRCAAKGTPLLMNEALWSTGQAVLTQIYSLRGLAVIAAFNISATLNNVFSISFISMGSAIAILIGQTLGAGKTEEARRDAGKYILFSCVICLAVAMLLFPLSYVFPQLYETSTMVRQTASSLIRIIALFLPMHAFLNACYFIMRSGGKTIITFLFDSAFVWMFSIPAAWLLTRQTDLPILQIFFCVQALDLVKCIIGFVLVKRGVWAIDISSYRKDS